MVDAKCKKNQLSIGKAGEAVLNTMMTIMKWEVQNYLSLVELALQNIM